MLCVNKKEEIYCDNELNEKKIFDLPPQQRSGTGKFEIPPSDCVSVVSPSCFVFTL